MLHSIEMNRFFRELKRRSIFQVAGLYAGIAWIVLQFASTTLPAFDVPEWVFRGIVIVTIAGFPVAIALAWIYEITSAGIKRDEEVQRERIPRALGRRKLDFVVMGVLVVALGVSVYYNSRRGEQLAQQALPPTTILIGDLENRTGDPVFGGTLEHALAIGLEGASFISAFPRDSALKALEKIAPGGRLDPQNARLVAVREGIKLVLTGSVASEGDNYLIVVEVIDVAAGEDTVRAKAKARGKLQVLAKAGEVASEVRRALGDEPRDDSAGGKLETFTVGSLDAAFAYTRAQDLARQGKNDEAIALYEKATQLDPKFGRAYSGWALSAFKLGRPGEAQALWQKAIANLGTMTEREKYRTMGLYYSIVGGNHEKSIENYRALVQQYPADGAAHNNLAVAYFLTLHFKEAMQEGRKLLEIYPNTTLYRGNYALYAMYAGEFQVATEEARKLAADDASYHKAHLPLAVSAALAGDLAAARASYESMSRAGTAGASLAASGLADLALFAGEAAEVPTALQAALEADRGRKNQRGLADKGLLIAETHLLAGRATEARSTLEKLAGDLSRDKDRIAVALLYMRLGDVARAEEIAKELTPLLDRQSRAYAHIIEAEAALSRGKYVEAVDRMREAKALADLWLGRLTFGRAYLAAGYPAEALAEFEECHKRIGEATALFLDDVPTLRFIPELDYWSGRANEALGNKPTAKSSYERFVKRRSAGSDPRIAEARRRIAAIP